MTEKELKEKIFELNELLQTEKSCRANEKFMTETLRKHNHACEEYIYTLERINEEYLVKIASLKRKINLLINDTRK